MRDLSDPDTSLRPGLEPGGWLHLDVSFGCAGDMLCAALLDLGVEERVLREALVAAGLFAVGPRVARDRRGGIAGTHLTFVDEDGRPLQGGAEGPLRVRRPPPSRRARARTFAPHPDARPKESKRRAGLALDEAGTRVEDEARDEAENLPRIGGEVVTPEEGAAKQKERDPVRAWLLGERAKARALLARIEAGRLSPLCRAVAHKALRRALEALAKVRNESLEALSLDGRAAVDLLADVVSFAALLEALSPSRVTASPVGVSTAPVEIDGEAVPGPSPWVIAVLEGIRAEERELPFECTTPTGAALLWSVVHRFGPRGQFVPGPAGVGLGTRAVRGHANLCRALYGPAKGSLLLGAKGDAFGAAHVEALLFGGDRGMLFAELRKLGATSLSVQPGLSDRRAGTERIAFALPAARVPEATRLLIVHGGAEEVIVHPAEREVPATRTVTVALGRGKKRWAIRIVERRLAGSVLRADPDPGDLLEAARGLGLPEDAVRLDAMAAWSRIEHKEGAAEAADGPGESEER